MAQDCYEVLGVAPTATPDEIRAAYRRLARRYHPDLHAGDGAEADAEARMQAINVAYNTLSDPQLRHQHDLAIIRERQNGHGSQNWRRPGTGGGGPGSATGNTAGNAGGAGGTPGPARRRRTVFTPPPAAPREPQRGADIETTLFVNHREAQRGTRKTLLVERMETCPRCRGRGLEPEETVLKSFCWRCGGAQRLHRELLLPVSIPAARADGARLRLRGQGHAGTDGGLRGHLFITVRIYPRENLLRAVRFALRHFF